MSNIFCIGDRCFKMDFIKSISCDDQQCTIIVKNTIGNIYKGDYIYVAKNNPNEYNQIKKYFDLLKKKSS